MGQRKWSPHCFAELCTTLCSDSNGDPERCLPPAESPVSICLCRVNYSATSRPKNCVIIINTWLVPWHFALRINFWIHTSYAGGNEETAPALSNRSDSQIVVYSSSGFLQLLEISPQSDSDSDNFICPKKRVFCFSSLPRVETQTQTPNYNGRRQRYVRDNKPVCGQEVHTRTRCSWSQCFINPYNGINKENQKNQTAALTGALSWERDTWK